MKRRTLKLLIFLLSLVLALECAYCVAVFTDWVPPLAQLRQTYIETAWATLNHRWLATAFLPGDVVLEAVAGIEEDRHTQLGLNSESWPEAESRGADFFEIFTELDEAQVRSWVESHPEAIENGWDRFYVNEAGLDDAGTELYTRQGDQVLAIDAENGLLVVRILGQRCRGVLILGKEPSKLRCAAAESWGESGQTAGQIAEANGALAALTASGFRDSAEEGTDQVGASMSSGVLYGQHLPEGYKRLELRSDDRLYITDAPLDFHPEATDASEWTPALIVDGEIVVTEEDHYNVLNPRCCLGQTADGTVLMLCIEGRYLDSLGASAPECAEILARYDCYQAMNLDGGTSAICWYQGEYITRCSDPDRPEGRPLPNAWIYG